MTIPFAIKQRTGHLVINSNDTASLKTLAQQIENFAAQVKDTDHFVLRLEMAFSETSFRKKGPRGGVVTNDAEAVKEFFNDCSRALGVNTRELASRLGVSRSTIYNASSGKFAMSPTTANLIIKHAPTPELKAEAQRLFVEIPKTEED